MSKKLAIIRKPTGWNKLDIYPTITMFTPLPIDKELWSLLNSYSEIKDRGQDLMQKYNILARDVNSTWEKFRSFIRQADNYWDAAKNTSYKSSALLYYYSFLNLVKAYLILEQPNLPNKVKHGLNYNTETSSCSLNKAIVKITQGQNQIFDLYYQNVFNTRPPGKSSVLKLLAHAHDISFQYSSGNFGDSKTYPFIHRVFSDKDRMIMWSVIAIPKVTPLSRYRKVYSNFFSNFEEIDFINWATSELERLLDLTSFECKEYNFYQSKNSKIFSVNGKTTWGDILDELKSSLSGWIAPNYNGDKYSAYLNLPHSINNPYLINEELALYMVMFFMSDIVRYRPDILDKFLSKRPAWLLECFVETCPLKFLKAITSRILKQVYIMNRF